MKKILAIVLCVVMLAAVVVSTVSADEAKNLAKELWNEEVERISRIMTQAGH